MSYRERFSASGGLSALLACGLAAALRLYQIRDSLWIDELHTAWVVSDGWSEIAARARTGNQTPLYFQVLWLVTQVLGNSEWTLRLPSLVAGLLLVLGIFVWVKRVTNCDVAAFASAATAAFDPILIFYSQEARPYAWVQLLSLLHVVSLARIVEPVNVPCAEVPAHQRHRNWSLLWIVSLALAVNLHITAGLLLAVDLFVFGAILLREPNCGREFWRRRAIDISLVLLLSIPATLHLPEVAERRLQWSTMSTSILGLWQSWHLATYLMLPLVGLAGARLAIRQTKQFDSRETIEPKRTTALKDHRVFTRIAVLWLAIPSALAWSLTASGLAPLFAVRFLNSATAARPILTGMLLAKLPSSLGKLGASSILLAMLILDSGYFQQYRHDRRFMTDRNENWRDAIQQIANSTEFRDAPVLLFPGLFEDQELRADQENEALRRYCLFPIQGLYRIQQNSADLFPLPSNIARLELPQDATDRIVNRRGVWLLIRNDQTTADAIAEKIASLLRQFDQRVEIAETVRFSELSVIRLRLTEPAREQD